MTSTRRASLAGGRGRVSRFVKTDDPTEIPKFSLDRLLHTDAALGNRAMDSAFRIAMRRRIDDMQKAKHQSWVRLSGFVGKVAVLVLLALTAQWLRK